LKLIQVAMSYQWLLLVLSKGRDRVGVYFFSPEGGNRLIQKHCVYRYLEWPPLWSTGLLVYWLQIQRSRVRFPALPDFLRSSGFGTGSTQPLSTTEVLLGRKSSGSGLGRREYGRGDSLRRPRDILYPQRLAITSPTSGGRSAGILCSRTKAKEFSFSL
jgi:hypothetical protein